MKGGDEQIAIRDKGGTRKQYINTKTNILGLRNMIYDTVPKKN